MQPLSHALSLNSVQNILSTTLYNDYFLAEFFLKKLQSAGSGEANSKIKALLLLLELLKEKDLDLTRASVRCQSGALSLLGLSHSLCIHFPIPAGRWVQSSAQPLSLPVQA